MNKFKILIIICLMHSNIYSNLYDSLPKNSSNGKYFLLTNKNIEFYTQEHHCSIGPNALTSLMYFDMIENFKKLKQENMALKNQINNLENKIDLLIAKFNADPPPVYGIE